jgi:tetratricopeptide (TPR) repeat protein
VTTRDHVVESIAQGAVRALPAAGRSSGNRNIDFTAAVFDAVENLGIAYVPDPNNPYTAISGTPKAVDTIFYPRETLARGAGDCDDTSVLLAALLGNVGIHTQFVDVPGHIFLLVSTDLHARNRLALGLDDSLTVIDDDEVWIPLETTALGKGFAEAWRIGAESYAGWASRGRVERIDVGAAQSRYEPGWLPDPATTPALDAGRLATRLGADLGAIAAWREAHLDQRFAGLRDSLEASPAALNEVARVCFLAGRMDDAGVALARALEREPGSARTLNNLGALDACRGDLERAAQRFQAAGGLEPGDAGIWLNLGLARYLAGDSTGAREPLDRGITLSGGYAQACALLGLAPEEPTSRGGATRMSAAEARELLKSALKKVPRPATGAREPARRPGRTRPWTSRVAGGRSADRAELADLVYWKR